jgi:hypothetical protein
VISLPALAREISSKSFSAESLFFKLLSSISSALF